MQFENKERTGLIKIFSHLRQFLFKNQIGESIISILADYPITFKVSRKLIVPAHQYPLNSYRTTTTNNIKLKLDISNEVDHFIYFKNKDTSFDHLKVEIGSAFVILDIG